MPNLRHGPRLERSCSAKDEELGGSPFPWYLSPALRLLRTSKTPNSRAVWLPDAGRSDATPPYPRRDDVARAFTCCPGGFLIRHQRGVFVIALTDQLPPDVRAHRDPATISSASCYSTFPAGTCLAVGLPRQAAMFHLFTHAFFKALFPCAARSSSCSTTSKHRRGGTRRPLGITFLPFLIGTLALIASTLQWFLRKAASSLAYKTTRLFWLALFTHS